MAWLRWQQLKADIAERRAIRHYTERREAYRVLCDAIADAERCADAYSRLELALQHTPDPRVTARV